MGNNYLPVGTKVKFLKDYGEGLPIYAGDVGTVLPDDETVYPGQSLVQVEGIDYDLYYLEEEEFGNYWTIYEEEE